MSNQTGFLGRVAALALGVFAATTARGDTINADAKGGVGQLQTVSWGFDGHAETGLAGTLTATINGAAAVDAYCIDLYDTTHVGNGGSTYGGTVRSNSDFTAAAAGHPSGGNAPVLGDLYDQFATTVKTGIDGAALQVAIWKAEYDGYSAALKQQTGDGYSLASGKFTFADSANLNSTQHLVYQEATNFLSSVTATSTGNATWIEPTSHGRDNLYQDLIGPAAVPEPAAVAMSLVGLVGVAGLATRRRRVAR